MTGDVRAIVQGLVERAQAADKDLTTLHGYRVEKELGHGGMGAVYLLKHVANGDRLAIKLILPRAAEDTFSEMLFAREIANIRALDHPNVVKFHDAGLSESVAYFTMEFCDGGSVDRLAAESGGTLAVDQAVPLILDALDGLEYAHQAEVPFVELANGTIGRGRGLVHRDLKPQNLFVSGSGDARRVKIGDYGLAKAFDCAGLSGMTPSGSGVHAGTPVFQPRQQAINFKYAKPEVDVWAMAASLYYLLSGEFPRDFPNGKNLWSVVLGSNVIPIRQRQPSIPKRLADVIDRALDDRGECLAFQSAAEWKQALKEAIE